MYEKPTLERFGTFEELTLAGFSGSSDGWVLKDNAAVTGCDVYPGGEECRS